MFPPHVVPPGVHPSADGAEVVTPVSLVEWFLNFYDEAKSENQHDIVMRLSIEPSQYMQHEKSLVVNDAYL